VTFEIIMVIAFLTEHVWYFIFQTSMTFIFEEEWYSVSCLRWPFVTNFVIYIYRDSLKIISGTLRDHNLIMSLAGSMRCWRSVLYLHNSYTKPEKNRFLLYLHSNTHLCLSCDPPNLCWISLGLTYVNAFNLLYASEAFLTGIFKMPWIIFTQNLLMWRIVFVNASST